ncbi:DNA-binding SARP family transcriptional activator/tetratricopeptide (TPR) repeat protein [Amycolatopsis bartoniae]|uniref:SARP family transcriptional regulator n=1 Tax=Amycolatopsis bartoniae TaxID=941986 RepID=A0A8H9MEV9_9PSEU|nr:BTAD domain-containing putative transcriptional regulator [Amycolatopsis bartoniae]MBB2935550.1 DNA-binding SARP family transcriptional activator/tetratricopeptide (TPR) repeat protein [Amycolatopsis bartoniae]GHF76711.1 SARP family transcriptional regulator [Amycolatopsis bartoniae]
MVKFGVLGPLAVWEGGRQLPLGGPKPRKVLAALVLAQGRVVPLGHLVDVVWEADPPASAEKQVRNAVSELRRTLTGHPIEAVAGGYLLGVGDRLDALDFTRRTERARSLAAEGRAREAVVEFRAALALWRGPALAGLDCPALGPQANGLDEQRLTACEECAELELALGRHREITGELALRAEENPLRERLAAQLMTALHRSGSRAEAALVYRRIRSALREELGIEPGPQLRKLYEDVTGGETGHWTPRRDLPRDISYFTGRATELDRLLSVTPGAEGTTMVISAIDGMAGVGKTTLAVHAAHRLAGRFPDAQLFVDLHAHTPGQRPATPAAVLEKLLRALGVPGERIPRELEDRAALWRAQLARRRALVVLDNAVDTAQVEPLLPGSPQCLTLVTSRHRLTGLDADIVALDLMPVDDARRLFVRGVGDERPFDEPGATDEVLQLCGRLPLAIRIAAARLRHRPSWTISYLASRLRDERRRLDELRTEDHSVTVAFTLSYEHLETGNKQLFRALGLVPGADIEPHAAAALTGRTPRETEEQLESLVDANLLQQAVPGRYHFHDLLRAHATNLAVRTDSAADRRATLTRLFDHYLSTASAAMDVVAPTERAHRPTLTERAPVTADLSSYDAALAWLNAERVNLVAMSGHALAHGWFRHASRLAATMWRYFHISGNHGDALVMHTNALAAARADGDIAFEADALASRGYINWWLGRYQQALDDCRAAVRIATDLGDRSLEGRALHALGLIHTRMGATEDAERTLQRTLDAGRATGDRILEGYALRGLGEVYLHLGRRREAVARYEEAVSVARSAGNSTIEGYALRALGEIYSSENQHEKALTQCLRALRLARQSRNRNIENRALRTLGEVHRHLGEHDESYRRFEEALWLAKETGNRYEEACAHEGAGQTRYAQGDPRSAGVHWTQALALFDELGVPERDRVRALLSGLADVKG